MVTGGVLFVGIGDDPNQADKQQLREIFRQLGKPMLNQCPGLTSLPAWETYQEWEGEKMKDRFYLAGDLPSDLLVATVYLEQDGVELLSQLPCLSELHSLSSVVSLDFSEDLLLPQQHIFSLA
ncbi:cyclin-dependent kinase B1-1-like [Rosa chinensis]|uniref:cyclin-dependent kinase B1-1-like n=1 Tax=Rosa chinensis TaxID=74649 RepID=UPI000D096F87|nr:cyclin-dependent kinase B1-1-like [Rosa chinensis]